VRKFVNFVASYLEIEQLDVISGNNLAGYGVSRSFPRALLSKARGAFGEGTSSPNVSVGDGNPSLPRRMGPRIREDDKIVSPSFPICFVLPPRAFLFNARGALGVGGNPVLPRRMGPRIREDDKTVNPSFPPEDFCSIPPRMLLYPRGVLGGAFSAQAGIHSLSMYH